MIRLRYKDTAKHVIWQDCALPEEYSRCCLAISPNYSKHATIHYRHAGNHQATVAKLKNCRAVPFVSSKTFPRNKHQKQQFSVYPAGIPPLRCSTKIKKEKHIQLTASTDLAETIVDIEDDRTPIPKQIINSVRRSESGDETESIVNLTSPLVNESGFYEGDVSDYDDMEPNLQIKGL